MSDASQGPGWWQASDGKWYAPDQISADHDPDTGAGFALPTPGAAPVPEVPPVGGTPVGAPPPAGAFSLPPAPTVGQPPAPGSGPPTAPAYGQPPAPGAYGAPGAAAYGPPPVGGYGYPAAPGYGYAGGTRTNGLAVASMVCSFFFWFYAIPAIVAIVLGFIARGQIKRSNGTQTGGGMALTGIIIGFAGVVIGIVLIFALVAVVHHCNQTGNCTTNTG